jgi:hypothetical protein
MGYRSLQWMAEHTITEGRRTLLNLARYVELSEVFTSPQPLKRPAA